MSASIELATTSRVGKLRKWLSSVPQRADSLQLQATGESGEAVRLGTWEASEVNAELAPDIIALVDGHAEETEEPAKYDLAFMSAAGRQLKGLPMARKSAGMDTSREVDDNGFLMDGSAKSMATQAQAFAQVAINQMIRSNAIVLQNMASVCEQAVKSNQALAEELRAARKERERAETEARAATRELARALEGDVAADGQPSSGGAALAEMLTPHLPQLMQVLQFAIARSVQGTAHSSAS